MIALLSIPALVLATVIVAAAWAPAHGTTLRTAIAWCVGGLALGTASAASGWFIADSQRGWTDLLWYLAAVVLLCPGIAVLGARRPGAAVWGFFVLLPLVLVLLWPAVASTDVIANGVPLALDTPAQIAFGVVLVMASGNWLATRYTLPMVGYVLALMLFVGPSFLHVSDWLPSAEVSRLTGSIVLLLSVVIASGLAATHYHREFPWDTVWTDFVDSFGLVWAKRVMDRVNQSAAHEKWCATLQLTGFEWQPGASPEERERTIERIEHTLRWLMKRFVDDAWLEPRFNHPVKPTEDS